jgi:hypothetical protein
MVPTVSKILVIFLYLLLLLLLLLSILAYWLVVDPRGGLDTMEKRKLPSPSGNRTPIVQPGARHNINANLREIV